MNRDLPVTAKGIAVDSESMNAQLTCQALDCLPGPQHHPLDSGPILKY